MKKQNSILMLIVLVIAMISMNACSSSTSQKETKDALQNQSGILLDYFLENGDFINDPLVPAVLNSGEIYSKLETENILLIDIRSEDQFAEAHIPGSVNVQPADLIEYMNSGIEASSFDKIIFVDNRGQMSSYATSITRLLGFDNTFFIRFGLSSWNEAFATTGWDMIISNVLEGKLEHDANEKAAPTTLPNLQTNGTTAYEIAKERAQYLLSQPISSFTKSYQDVMEKGSEYYVVNYWPNEKYVNYGHIPGAVQYTPKKTLHPDADLLTLPTDKPVIVYCFTGMHSAHVVAYLRMLGYDAYSIIYGSNSFIHATLANFEEKPGTYWSDFHKKNFPIIGGDEDAPVEVEVEVKTIQGGC